MNWLSSFYFLIFLALPDGDNGQVLNRSPFLGQLNKINLRSLPKNVSNALVKLAFNSRQAPWAIEQKLGRIARPEVLRNWNAYGTALRQPDADPPPAPGDWLGWIWWGIKQAAKFIADVFDMVWQDTQFLVSWLWNPKPEYYYDKDTTRQMCYIMQQSYRSSLSDIHRYSELRQWYTNSLEFEIGYLVHEIIFKYELMVEIYDLVYKQYTKNVTRNYTPIPYMLEMYRNMLEHASDVLHVTNLLHEVEKKYDKKRKWFSEKSMWSDYEEDDDDPEKIKLMRNPKVGSKNRGTFVDMKKLIEDKEDFEKKQRLERRKRIAQQRRLHQRWMNNRYRDWSTKKKKKWQEDYGWSIEEW